MIFVTGGAGFIGSHFLHRWFSQSNEAVVNLDALTYAGQLEHLSDLTSNPNYHFVHGNILNDQLVRSLFQRFQPRGVVHLAAETHVDRSISDPAHFANTNVMGTLTLLEAARQYLANIAPEQAQAFRFINISTDEVYGDLPPEATPALESTPFNPSSPYSASKAAADQMGRAYARTYGLPVVTLRSGNNYGSGQYPEKLIPLMIDRALRGEALPLYGDGLQRRDWVHVDDFCDAITLSLEHAAAGEIFNVSAHNEQSNLAVIQAICHVLDTHRPRKDHRSYCEQISHTTDRPGHDRRYALNATHIQETLGWHPKHDFHKAFVETILSYLH